LPRRIAARFHRRRAERSRNNAAGVSELHAARLSVTGPVVALRATRLEFLALRLRRSHRPPRTALHVLVDSHELTMAHDHAPVFAVEIRRLVDDEVRAHRADAHREVVSFPPLERAVHASFHIATEHSAVLLEA